MFKLISHALYDNGEKEARFIIRWFAISLLIHFIVAYFSTGFYHYDEHFQILEFGGLKAGYTTPSALPWEYTAQIRPAFQPFIVYSAIRIFGWFRIHDPFIIATFLRFLSALLGWLGTFLITIATIRWLPVVWLRRLFIVFSAIFGSLIFIHVRFSSESWSGSFAFIAIALIILYTGRNEKLINLKLNPVFFTTGLFLGLSYVCRFQSLFLFPGIFLWLFFIGKVPIKKLLIICIGVAFAISIGYLLDRWFYGHWVNTVYNYYVKNIVEGVAAHYGVAPWWWYFPEIIKYGIYAMQATMLILVIIAVFRNRQNLLVWACVPFVVAHCMVSHKELRFLFPVTDALPILVALGVYSLHIENLRATYLSIASWIIIAAEVFFIVFNAGILFNLCKLPPQPYINAMHWVYLHHTEPVDIVVDDKYLKLTVDSTLKTNFYKRLNVRYIYISNPDSLKIIIDNDTNTVLLMASNLGFQLDNHFFSSKPYMIQEYCPVPLWMRRLDLNNWQERTSFWEVYRAVKPKRIR